MRPLGARAFVTAAAALAAALGACSDPTPQLLVRLQPDPTRQSAPALAASLARLQIIVDDAEPGVELAGLPAGPGGAAVAYVDVDGDGAREIAVDLPWHDAGRLPLIGVTAGVNDGRAILVRVEGYDAAGVLVALGGAAAVVLGAQPEASVPFNLLPARLPPRVIATQPEAGQLVPRLGDFAVTFSRRVRPETLTRDTVFLECTAGGVVSPWYPAAVAVALEQFENPALARHRATLTLEPASDVTASCAVVVRAAVRADDDTPFDQDATRPGADDFRGAPFQVGSANAVDGTDCRRPQDDPGRLDCPAELGLRCDEATGACLTRPACGTCAAGALCDPRTARCAEDCRPLGACADPAAWCDAAGLCGR
ncbi:MAG TPA: hypothetical protein VGQ83_34465 [Polyangia bacterium]